VFHPLGELVAAASSASRLRTSDSVESADIIERVSKAIGILDGLPDLIGLAWRMRPRPSNF
jgi:hypothetical protein